VLLCYLDLNDSTSFRNAYICCSYLLTAFGFSTNVYTTRSLPPDLSCFFNS